MAALTPDVVAVARALAGTRWADEIYLAGSAALAIHVGHRHIRSLDLMAPALRLRSPERRDLLADLLEIDPGVRVETARDGFLFTRWESGVATRFYYYPYPLAAPESEWEGLGVASLLDLGLMKLGAIISRGTRRDFVDLYLLCQEIPLEEMLRRAPEKYGHVRDFPLQALKGLADRSLVEGEPMPKLTSDLAWTEVEEWLDRETRRLGRDAAGLSG